MRGRIYFVLLALLIATALFSSCQELINYPAPTLIALSPNNTTAGQPPFTLTVTGNHLTPATAVVWNGLPLAAIFVSGNEMTATIPAALIQNPAQISVILETPQPGGGISQPLTFTINPTQAAIPTLTYINPTSVMTGTSSALLYVYGTNFVSLSTVTVNGSNRPTSFTSPTTLIAALTASDVSNSGTLQIAVVSPPPGGGSSNPVSLTITNPVPAISGLTPSATLAGSVPPALTIAGSSFVSNSYITINGVPRTTIFGGSTSLATLLTTADMSVGGINQIQVVNPAPGGGKSNLLTYPVNPATTIGLPVLVDLDPNGFPALSGICGSDCSTSIPSLTTAGPTINSNGQFVAFSSMSDNLLLAQSTTTPQVFLRSTCLGLGTSCIPRTEIISVSSTGADANGPSWEPSLDSNASDVAYTSEATNLVTTTSVPSGVRQVYWGPVCTAATCNVAPGSPTTTLVSVAADGVTPGNADSYNPVISPDGQYVAFTSLATNLVSSVDFDGVTPQVFIRATCGGLVSTTCLPTTYLVSSPDLVTPGNAPSSDPAISTDGEYVSFTSSATNLGATAPNPGSTQQVFRRTTCVTTLGQSTNTCTPINYLMSTPDGVTPANSGALDSAVSTDGRFVAFATTGTNLGTASGGTQEIYVRDTCLNVTLTTCTPSTILISTADGVTPANGFSEHPSINGCGATTSTCTTAEIIGFASKASNLGVNVSNGVENIFTRNACLVVTTTITCTPLTNLASQPAGTSPQPSNGNSYVPAISGDGHSVVFISFANDLVPFPSSGFQDIYLAPTLF